MNIQEQGKVLRFVRSGDGFINQSNGMTIMKRISSQNVKSNSYNNDQHYDSHTDWGNSSGNIESSNVFR